MQTIQHPDTTKVIYGVNELDLELAGKPVSEIWKHLEQVFNIPRDAVVMVNGTRVDTPTSSPRATSSSSPRRPA